MKKYKAVLLSVVYLISFRENIQACSWCEEWKKVEHQQADVTRSPKTEAQHQDTLPAVEKEKEEFVTSFFANLTPETSISQTQKPEQEKQDNNEQEQKDLQEFQNEMASLLQNLQSLFNGNDVPEELSNLLVPKKSGKQVPDVSAPFSPKEIRVKTEAVGQKFYTAYLARFYPKALVIGDYFFEMCPLAVLGVFNEFVTMLTDETWFVFKNKPEKYKNSEHWEIIIDQCKQLDWILSHAYVDVKLNKVVDGTLRDAYQKQNLISIKEYWTQNGLTSFYDFYAYYAGYIKRMFNEGIIFEDLMQSYHFAKVYNDVLKNIPESMYDGKYHEHQKINKELLAELRKKQGIESFLDPYFDNLLDPVSSSPLDFMNTLNAGDL